MTDAGPQPAVDGRRLRRERGRQAVLDATIDLVLEGHAPPSAEQVTERAGVSQASLFRYFATLGEMRREAIGRYLERFDEQIAIHDIGVGALDDRIERFVRARDAFYAHTAPMARLARRQAADVSDLADTIDRVRATFADQTAQHFASELDRFDADRRDARLAAIAALTSFEGWDQLAGLGAERRRAAMCDAVTALLGGHGT